MQLGWMNRNSSLLPCCGKTADLDRTISLPSLAQQLELASVYFQRCHNQPYCYFHERSFYRRLRDNSLPPFLVLAVLATAARFTASVTTSVPTSILGRPDEELADVYAQRSWAIIMRQTMASSFHVHLHFVQATNLLAVIDFTSECGRRKQFNSFPQDYADTQLLQVDMSAKAG